MQSKEIGEALKAHRQWKARLARAIETGDSDYQPNTVKADNQCNLGKWLLQLADEPSTHYATVKQLHTQFHLAAGHVLDLALQGRKVEAQSEFGVGSRYGETAAALSAELIAWYLEKTQAQDTRTQSLSAEKQKTILEERARALAKSADVENGESVPLVVFSLANETYGIATEYVHEVQPLRGVTPVPCTPEFVVGVINIRGSIYSVVDIRSFFGVPKKEITEATKVILVNAAGLEVGILADDVSGATSVSVAQIKAPLSAQGTAKDEYVQGVTQEMLIILNLEALLRDERMIIHEEVG